MNQRWIASPDYVCVPTDTAQVVQIVDRAVREGRRIAVRSGGHCVEQMVGAPEVEALIDMSEINDIDFDPERDAFVVGSGATVGQVYRTLHKRWGVTVPAGSCLTVGMGGHIAGGGYGPLSRRFGYVSDYLHAVEVVVVDADGTARAVVATAADEQTRDLWWAHTGGGGGNFGVITRYWLRIPGATGSPTELLPRPPARVLLQQDVWVWDSLDEEKFTRLLRNHNEWYERNSDPDSPANALYSGLWCGSRASAFVAMCTMVDADAPNASAMLADYVSAVCDGVMPPALSSLREVPWLHATSWGGIADSGDHTLSFKIKAADLRRRCTDKQISRIYRHLTRTDYDNHRAGLMFVGCGGRMNALSTTETAIVQRDSILKLVYSTHWENPAETDRHLAWLREFYADVYAETGGVPVPNEQTNGSYVNNPDFDVFEEQWNKSGLAWHELYYQHNYPRLQRVKQHWDPLGIFTNPFAVRPPEVEGPDL
ncbi:FAD-binding oxidoreductase [Rugosimonospora acidiphila]|uniref:FAD-binding oxidoreductase n=1 Tax=Rugosimonospora acidiphila TaxID=556531 RepID=UPI0031ED27D2